MDYCCESIVKYFLILLNLIFVMISFIIMGTGAYIYIKGGEFFSDIDYENISIILIILGVFIFIISFLGFFGALFEKVCMIYTYAILLITIFMVEICVGLALFIRKDQLELFLTTTMKAGMKEYNADEANVITWGWDMVQTELECCGAVNATDWGHETPGSCCDGGVDTNCEDMFTVGC